MEDLWSDSREKLDERDFRSFRTAANVILVIQYRSTWRFADEALVLRIGVDSPPARTRVENFDSGLAAVFHITETAR
jgi:hypothetical protein